MLDGHQGAIRKKTTNRNTTLLFDEWTDERGVPVLAIIAHVGGRLKFCIDVAFLEGKGPQRGVEHKEIAGALLSSLATAQIHPDRINFVISDEGSTVVAAAIAGCFNGVWGGGSIGALLLLAEGVTPLLLNHSRRVRLPYHTLHVEPGP